MPNGNVSCTGTLTVGDQLTLKSGTWHQTEDGVFRFFYDAYGTTYFHSGSAAKSFVFRNYIQSDIFTIKNTCQTGILNSDPFAYLHLGNADVPGSYPTLCFGKRLSDNTGFRNCLMGYNDSFIFYIGDFGNSNTLGNNSLVQQLQIYWASPSQSLCIQDTGYVTMRLGYGTGSDERLKTDIKTIENALDKTLLLRGVEFKMFEIEPDRKRIGLIAQEVELIVPEVVREYEGIKSIEYQNLVGLLVEAIKELNNKVINLENILIKNNLI